MTSTPNTISIGVDLGTQSIKSTLGSTLDYELVRNLHGGHTTPSSVSFKHKQQRLIGEDASEAKNADGNTVLYIPRLVFTATEEGKKGELDEFYRFRVNDEEEEEEEKTVCVTYNDEEKKFTTSALLAMLLGRAHTCVDAAIHRKLPSSSSSSYQTRYMFALPSTSSPKVKETVVNAAYAAGLMQGDNQVQVVSMAECSAAVYQRRFGQDFDREEEEEEEKKRRIVLVVDMGHSQTVVSVLRLSGEEEEIDNDEKKEKKKKTSSKVSVLSTVTSSNLGGANIDIVLYRHFTSTMPTLSNLTPNSRRGQKLLEGCRKLKHLLSMLHSNKVIVESLTENDGDVTLTATRDMLHQLCHKECEALSALIDKAIKEAGVEEKKEIDAVEIMGGGCRIPFVQQTIVQAIERGDDENMILSKSFDDTSIALGAAMIGDTATTTPPEVEEDVVKKEKRIKLREAEIAMLKLDTEMAQLSETRNKIESHILELRSAKHDVKYGSLLPTKDNVLDTYLKELDDWLFSEECDNATLDEMKSKLESVLTKSRDLCKEYYEAMERDAKEVERQMVEEEERAKAEQAANGGEDGEEEDHDNRRLPKKRRMEIVMKNKNEANELFADKNYRFAAARYVKALTHCSKFYDLTLEDEAEVKSVKTSLHLNLALAYYKLEKYDNALRSCNDALELDGDNVKALFRRATVYYEKKKWEDAKRDLDRASEMAPEDKAVQKLQGRLELQMKRQKAKEKKMAKKMFG